MILAPSWLSVPCLESPFCSVIWSFSKPIITTYEEAPLTYWQAQGSVANYLTEHSPTKIPHPELPTGKFQKMT